MPQKIESRSMICDVVFTDSMPHMGMGKIDYNKLADDYKDHLNKMKAV